METLTEEKKEQAKKFEKKLAAVFVFFNFLPLSTFYLTHFFSFFFLIGEKEN